MALSDLLLEKTISINLEASTSKEVITHLGQLLVDAGLVKDTFVDAAIAREAALPTGLPLGGEFNAAIPHTDIIHVNASGVALATLPHPVTFQNMVMPSEGVDCRLVFLLALDQPHAQIEMLQEIAGILQDADIIKNMVEAKTPAEIIQTLKTAGK